jgi:hypothetical protein
MATSTEGPRQFQGLFDTIASSQTVDPGDAAAGAEVSATVTITGAALGDFVLVAPGVDVVDVTVQAYVTAADTVTWVVGNVTGDHVNLASSTWNFLVLKPKGVFNSIQP